MEQRVQEQAELDEIWDGDLLGRARDAEFLQRFLEDMALRRATSGGGSYVLNIDAEWGSGKTFFMDRFARQLQHSGHLVARVNAWRDDHMDDPFTSVLFAIDEALSSIKGKKASTAKRAWKTITTKTVPVIARVASGATKTFIRKKVGAELDDILNDNNDASGIIDADFVKEAMKSGTQELTIEIENVIDHSARRLIESFKKESASSEIFRVKLGRVVENLHKSTGALLFVMVDELDRCRPSYAVSLLERVKHLFDAPKVVFVFATDSGQLRHSISGAYGPGFDGFGYLGRFFDRTYKLPQPRIDDIVAVEAADIAFDRTRCPVPSSIEFLSTVFEAYGITPRETLRVIDIIRSAVAAWPYRVPLDLVLLTPLAVEFCRSGQIDWRRGLEIPATIIFDLGSRIDPLSGRRHDGKFKLVEAFQALRGVIHNLQEASKIGGASTLVKDYAHATYLPEWHGRVVPDRPSVQSVIPDLIQHAGRIIDSFPGGVRRAG